MTAHGEEVSVDDPDADPSPALGHGRAGGPTVRVGVVALDGPQARTTVPTANRVQS